jgi:hypothetical protein
VLGNIFASMYPDRVGRMIFDASRISTTTTQATWAMNLVDTEKAVKYFYQR